MNIVTFKYKVSGNTIQYPIINSCSAKFEKDFINYEDESIILVVNGIVLNKDKIIEDHGRSSWIETLKMLLSDNSILSLQKLKGSYTIFFFDKRENKFFTMSDHIGSKPIYYYSDNEYCYCSNNYYNLLCSLKNDNIKVNLDVESAYLLLTYGYVFENRTIVNEIKRLKVGHYGVYENGRVNQIEYWKLSNTENLSNETDAIEGIDFYFKQALKQAFEKDIEHGLRHIVSLSGGLDSRMTTWVAHELGYTEQMNITFSQSDYLDEKIPKQISSDLKHEWLFKSLDNGLFLEDIDEITRISGGNVLYYGLAHGHSMYKRIKFDNFGILHTGQLGDVVFSSFSRGTNIKNRINIGEGAYSKRLLHKLSENILEYNYDNEEIYKMYIRGFYVANHGLLPCMNYTETYSPFYDIETLKYALSLPLKLRADHNLYKQWILRRYPNAAKYIWEKTKSKITDKNIVYRSNEIPLKRIPLVLLRKVGLQKSDENTKNHMNPLSYWYNTNDKLRNFQDSYFIENIRLLYKYPELMSDCKILYSTGNGVEKNQVLSLLSAIRMIIE